MKSLLLLWKEIAEESAIRCCTSAPADIKTVNRRFEHEGLSFLTITLPAFGKDFERSLDQGSVDRSLFTSFRRKGELPRFLGGFLDLVFDRASGRLLDTPSIDAILAVRQLSLMFGKMLLPCSDARERAAMERYVQCEQEVRLQDERRRFSDDLEKFSEMSRRLFGHMFSHLDLSILMGAHIPRHGPGSTADRLSGNRKYDQRTWPVRLERHFPFGEFVLPNPTYYNMYNEVDFLEPGSEMPVRVISVPKTLKTPRIIAMEPTAMQYSQQSIKTMMYEFVAQDYYLRRTIGFEDQTPNQRLASEGSRKGDLATLDLSEASDRVSNQLVTAMLEPYTYLHGAVQDSRSTRADVPGHDQVDLAKFASMGSALCFPMEALVFLTQVFLGIEEQLNRPLCSKDFYNLRNRVRVYGDDIIVPQTYVHSVIAVLERYGAVVNGAKSFWTGKFRESCGKEYYDGSDVSIVRVRRAFPASRKDAQEVMSIVSLRNQLYFAGYWRTCKWLDAKITGLIKFFPVVETSSPVQGRHSFLSYQAEKMDANLHSPLVKGYVSSGKSPINKLDGPGALTKFFVTHTGENPNEDANHLERSGRPAAVNIKLRYASPF